MCVGIKGFEPLNTRTKNECLTTWLYSTKELILTIYYRLFTSVKSLV